MPKTNYGHQSFLIICEAIFNNLLAVKDWHSCQRAVTAATFWILWH